MVPAPSTAVCEASTFGCGTFVSWQLEQSAVLDQLSEDA